MEEKKITITMKEYKELLSIKEKFKEQEKIINLTNKTFKIYPPGKKENHTMDYKKINKNNKFNCNGVCQDMRAFKRGKIKYRAYIMLFGKQYTLGTHNTLKEAIEARKKGEEKIKNILKNMMEE